MENFKAIPYGLEIIIRWDDDQKARLAAGEDWIEVAMGLTDADRKRQQITSAMSQFLEQLKIGTLDAMRQMVRIGDFSVVSHEAVRFLIAECDEWWRHRCD